MQYTSLNQYCQKTFGKKLYKLTLDGGFTCPNRDGKIATGGCIFCDGSGSGSFAGLGRDADSPAEDGPCSHTGFGKDAESPDGSNVCAAPFDAPDSNALHSDSKNILPALRKVPSISEQMAYQKALISGKLPKTKEIGYIAYFQAFTGTYAPIEYLEKVYAEALSDPDVSVLSIATRPDCISDEVLTLLSQLQKESGKAIWVELGLQSIHPLSASYIRRGYPLSTYDLAVQKLHAIGIAQIITHVILGLPGETKAQMLETVSHVANTNSNGIKLQLLHVLRNTDLATAYAEGTFQTLDMDAYLDILKECIELLPADMVVHRLTGDGDRKNLIAPLWSLDKKRVLNAISKL